MINQDDCSDYDCRIIYLTDFWDISVPLLHGFEVERRLVLLKTYHLLHLFHQGASALHMAPACEKLLLHILHMNIIPKAIRSQYNYLIIQLRVGKFMISSFKNV